MTQSAGPAGPRHVRADVLHVELESLGQQFEQVARTLEAEARRLHDGRPAELAEFIGAELEAVSRSFASLCRRIADAAFELDLPASDATCLADLRSQLEAIESAERQRTARLKRLQLARVIVERAQHSYAEPMSVLEPLQELAVQVEADLREGRDDTAESLLTERHPLAAFVAFVTEERHLDPESQRYSALERDVEQAFGRALRVAIQRGSVRLGPVDGAVLPPTTAELPSAAAVADQVAQAHVEAGDQAPAAAPGRATYSSGPSILEAAMSSEPQPMAAALGPSDASELASSSTAFIPPTEESGSVDDSCLPDVATGARPSAEDGTVPGVSGDGPGAARLLETVAGDVGLTPSALPVMEPPTGASHTDAPAERAPLPPVDGPLPSASEAIAGPGEHVVGSPPGAESPTEVSEVSGELSDAPPLSLHAATTITGTDEGEVAVAARLGLALESPPTRSGTPQPSELDEEALRSDEGTVGVSHSCQPYRYSTPAGDDARTIAARLRKAFTPATTHVACDLLWRLVHEERLGLAFHLSRALEQVSDRSLDLLPSWLLSSLTLGAHICTATGELATPLGRDLANFNDHLFATSTDECRHATRFLLFAAAIRPALIAPGLTGAARVLKDLRFKDGLTATFEFGRTLARFGEQLQAVDINALRADRDRAQWQQRNERLSADARTWWQQAPFLTMNFQAATAVWQQWLRSDGLLHRIMSPVLNDDGNAVDSVRKELERLRDRATLVKEVHRADRPAIRRGQEIHGPALQQILRRVEEALRLVQRWIELQEVRPGRERVANLRQRVDEIRRYVHSSAPRVRKEIIDFSARHHRTPLIDIGAQTAARAVERLQAVFAIQQHEQDEHEPPLRHLLAADLLRYGSFTLDADWNPELAGEPLVAALLDAVASGDPSWEQGFRARCEARDHEATARIIEVLSLSGHNESDLERLRRDRERELDLARRALKEEVRRTEQQVEEALALGLLGEEQRARLGAVVQRVTVSLPRLERFADASKQLEEEVRKVVMDLRRDAAARVRNRLAQLDVDDQARARIESCLENGDVLTANEYVDHVAEGRPLPDESSPGRDAFMEFFPEFCAGCLNALRGFSIRELAERIRRREGVAGLDLGRLPQERARAAGDLVELWFEAKRMDRLSDDQARRVMSFLGFRVRGVDRVSDRELHVHTEPLGDREECPVPTFGSAANGRYRLLLVWGQPSEEDVVAQVGDTTHGAPSLVFYFGVVSEQRRRRLARLCRERRRTFLLLDSALVLFLCGEAGSRLPTFFDCTLPLTTLEPYTTTAGEVAPEMFYGRRREREDVIRPNGTCFIYGGRQLGKTTLLREVERDFHAPSMGRIAYWIDLKAEGYGNDRPLDELWNQLAHRLANDGVFEHASVRAGAGAEAVSKHVKSWLDADPQRRILLMLDEADRFLEADGTERREGHNFLHTTRLKYLMEQTARRFKVVFAGLHNVQRFTRDSNNPLAHFGTPLCIGPLLADRAWREARALIERPLRALGYRFASPDLTTRILSQTNYYPSLIQLYCQRLLRHLNAEHFDPRTTPPYRIVDAHLEDVYQNVQLRDDIKHRFRLTLQLDQRYEVIAYAIALEDLQGARGAIDGFDVDWIRQQAAAWWPQGFAGHTDDDVRMLLQEMVGLGVLRSQGEPGGAARYALRSPNVVLLLGSMGDIESELIRDREPPLLYEPASFRPALPRGAGGSLELAPLTSQQFSELKRRENRVTIVAAVPAGAPGNDLVRSFESGFGGEAFHEVGHGSSYEEFTRVLESAKRGREEGIGVLVVRSEAEWSAEWVRHALARIARLTSSKRYLQVVFVADSTIAWQMMVENPGEIDRLIDMGAHRITVRNWHDPALRQWLQDTGVGPQDQVSRQELSRVTGSWPAFLYRFKRACAKGGPWTAHLEALAVKIEEEARALLRSEFGIIEPEALQVLSEVVHFRDEEVLTEIAALLGIPHDRATAIARWADFLGLATPAGIDRWVVDPLVARLISKVTASSISTSSGAAS